MRVRGALLTVTLLAACASAVQQPKDMVLLRADWKRLEADTRVDTKSPEFFDAARFLNLADEAFQRDPDSEEARALRYIARRKVQLIRAAVLEQEGREAEQAMKNTLALAELHLSKQEHREALRKEGQLADEERRIVQRQMFEAALADVPAFAWEMKSTDHGWVLEFPQSSLFYNGSIQLGLNARATVRTAASALQKGPRAKLRIIAEDSEAESGTEGTSLARRRAQRIRELFVNEGVSPDLVELTHRSGGQQLIHIEIEELPVTASP